MAHCGMRLRMANTRDKARIHQLFCLPKVYEYLADGEEPPPGIASDWIASAPADEAHYGGGLWVLVDDEQNLGGLVRLAGDDNGELELIYILHPRLWGHGLATRMAHTVMMRAFAAKKVTTIWAGADVPNTASIAVMKRLGMQYRREVEYSMGIGVEYHMSAEDFDPDTLKALPIDAAEG